ncbi:adenosylhomocysteinase [archaeon]|nr:adenosylhomocysteinase [archaeon]
MPGEVKDPSLAEEGWRRIEWARRRMPVLAKIRERFVQEQPLEGICIGMVLHVEAKTAVLVETLVAAGASIAITGCNPLTTQDAVAAALYTLDQVNVYAWRGETTEEYYTNINRVLSHKPSVLVDDGADAIVFAHTRCSEVFENLVGATEETTTGVRRLCAMEREGRLRIPVIDVNDARTKTLFDNRYGTGQSVIDGILRATNVLLAGKTVVVAGYGWCGRGIARRLAGMGARVIVCEVDPVKALEAYMDGFQVMPMRKAAKIGDLFITATGVRDVIRREHFEQMKDGAILANAGHFNVEISISDLEALTVETREVRSCVQEFRLVNGRRLYLLGEGRLVNLVCGDGHPIEVMDMSFANQALSVEYLWRNRGRLEPRVYPVPKEIDEYVARMKLQAFGVEIDELTDEQRAYISDWQMGT